MRPAVSSGAGPCGPESNRLTQPEPSIGDVPHPACPSSSRETSGASIRCTTGHSQGDSIERITHSICTWNSRPSSAVRPVLPPAGIYHPHRSNSPLELSPVMSKRSCSARGKSTLAAGTTADPALSGLRRRGYLRKASANSATRIGIAGFTAPSTWRCWRTPSAST